MKHNGGAATGAVRTHEAMLREGMDSQIMFMFESPNLPKSISFFSWAKENQRIRMLIWQLRGKIFGRQNHDHKYANILRVDAHPEVKRADVIVLHQVDGFIDVPSFIRNLKKPILWRCPDFSPITAGHHYPTSLEFNWESHVYAAIHWVFTTQVAKELVDSTCPFPVKTHLIYNPLAHGWKLSHEPARNHVLFCAADLSTKRKGFDLVHQLWKTRPDYPLLIAIGSNDTGRYEDLPNLRCVGRKTPEELKAWYASARLFLTPAQHEMFGQTTAEALSLGTPVISNRTIGARELIRHDEDGRIVDLFQGNNDLLLLEQACDEMLSKKNDYRQIAERNQPRFQTNVVRNYNTIVEG